MCKNEQILQSTSRPTFSFQGSPHDQFRWEWDPSKYFCVLFHVFIWSSDNLNILLQLCRTKETGVTQLINVEFCSPMNNHYFQVFLPIATSSSVLWLYTQAFYICAFLQKQPLLGFYLFRGSFSVLGWPWSILQGLLNFTRFKFASRIKAPYC